MKYRNFKRFKGLGTNCRFNFKFGTEFEDNEDGYIIHHNDDGTNDVLCLNISENCYEHLVPEFDEKWLERGTLRSSIWTRIKDARSDKEREAMFDKIWYDGVTNKYRKNPGEDRFEFDRFKLLFAPLEDLEHIWNLINQVK